MENRFRAVFRDQADAAMEFARRLAKAVGRSRFAIMDAMTDFQTFFIGLGFDSRQALEFSKSLTKAAIDFASFHNVSDEEAIRRLRSALAGSAEVMDQFGVNIREAALRQEALRMGVHKSWSEITEQQKALLRLSIIMRTMTEQGVTGDAIKTAGSFANRMKALRGILYDTSVEIGNALLPVLTPLVARLAEITKSVAGWIKQNKDLVRAVFIGTAAVGGLGIALMTLGTAIEWAGSAIGTIAGVIGKGISLFKLMAKALLALPAPLLLIGAAVATVAGIWAYKTGFMGKLLNWLGERFQTLKDDAVKAWEGIRDALAAGDIRLAAKVMWTFLKLEWTRGISKLYEAWAGFKKRFWDIVDDICYGLLSAWTIACSGMKKIWYETLAGLKKKGIDIVGDFRKAWETSEYESAREEIRQMYKRGEITREELQQALGRLGRDYLDRMRQIENEAAAKKKKINEETAKKIKDIEENASRQLEAISQAWVDAEKNRQKQYQQEIKSIAEELEKAKQDFEEARQAAARARAGKGAGKAPEVPTESEDEQKKIKDAFEQLANMANAASRNIQDFVHGAFVVTSPLPFLGGREDRLIKASEETAANTRKLVEATRRNRQYIPLAG